MIGQGRRRSGSRAGAIALALALIAVIGAAGGADTSAAANSENRAATHAYLVATYAYEKARVAQASASKAAAQALASRLGGECPGVLALAPQVTPATLSESGPPGSPRQIGERERELRQLGDLREELSDVLSSAATAPYREAALSYANVLGSLRWSDQALTRLRHTEASANRQELQIAPPSVCADMKAWASSGYRTLSPATKAFVREERAALAAIFRAVGRGAISPDQLTPDEGPGDKLLMRKINSLRKARRPSVKSLQAIDIDAASALGIAREPEPEVPRRRSVVIASGRTAAGSSYTIRLERQQPPQAKQPSSIEPEPSCRFQVTVSETGNQGEGESELVVLGSGGTCLSSSRPEGPKVSCEAGLLTIEAQTSRRTRSVRLRLSDGRQITSRVALVPARLGGPAGFYYQAVRGPSPIPVSLTELDAHDRTLRTVNLNRIRECTKDYAFAFLPGGLRTIAHGSAPGGPAFAIVGERYRAEGEVHFKLKVEIGEGGLLGGGILRTLTGGERPGQKRGPFSLEISKGCQPQEYAILYGLLKSPRDVVLARTAGALRPLSQVRIPASLHVNGTLAYIALSQLPSEVLVSTPSGKTVFTENLARLARETKETCEGEAEGPSA